MPAWALVTLYRRFGGKPYRPPQPFKRWSIYKYEFMREERNVLMGSRTPPPNRRWSRWVEHTIGTRPGSMMLNPDKLRLPHAGGVAQHSKALCKDWQLYESPPF